MRALVIDDSRAVRFLLGKYLRELGFEVTEAVHGKEALEKFKAGGPPELALVDWNMPEMNGLELIQAIRADHTFDDTRLMMVTTESEMENVVAALEAGANEYVMKPFTKESILEKLEILGLGQSGAGAF